MIKDNSQTPPPLTPSSTDAQSSCEPTEQQSTSSTVDNFFRLTDRCEPSATKQDAGTTRIAPSPVTTNQLKPFFDWITRHPWIALVVIVMAVIIFSPHNNSPVTNQTPSATAPDMQSPLANDTQTAQQTQSTEPQVTQQQPVAPVQDLGFTTQELKDRFAAVARKYNLSYRLGSLSEDTVQGRPVFTFTVTPNIYVAGQTVGTGKKVRFAFCCAQGRNADDAGNALVVFSTLIQAVDPDLTQAARNNIVTQLGFTIDQNTYQYDWTNLHGDYVQNNKRYTSANDARLGLVLRVSLPSDDTSLTVGAANQAQQASENNSATTLDAQSPSTNDTQATQQQDQSTETRRTMGENFTAAPSTNPSDDLGITFSAFENQFNQLNKATNYPLRLSRPSVLTGPEVVGYTFTLKPLLSMTVFKVKSTNNVRSVMLITGADGSSADMVRACNFLVSTCYLMKIINPELNDKEYRELYSAITPGDNNSAESSINKQAVRNGKEYSLVGGQGMPLTLTIQPSTG